MGISGPLPVAPAVPWQSGACPTGPISPRDMSECGSSIQGVPLSSQLKPSPKLTMPIETIDNS